MAAESLAEWATTPWIYVENERGRDPAYTVTSDAVLRALVPRCCPRKVTVRFSDDRDLESLRLADIFVAGRLDTNTIASHGKRLKLIQCTSAGVDRYMPFDWLGAETVLTNASGVHAEKAGEFALMATLMLHQGVPAIATNQRNHRWHRNLCGLATDRRVLIYGVGALGGAVAERLRSAGFRVTGVRRSGEPHHAVEYMTTPDHLGVELPKADIVILTCPLTSETAGLMTSAEFASMPAGSSLLNIARAGIVDHRSLVAALQCGHLSGAILDVFEEEPLPNTSPLWNVPNLMIFPHVSADAPVGYIDRCLRILSANMERVRRGAPLLNNVDRRLGY